LANINELNLKADEVDVSFDDMPDPGGQYTPNPKPGSYKFTLPSDLRNVWEVIERNGKERVQATFDFDNALMYRSIRGSDVEDLPWTTRINNAEYSFGDGASTSNMAQLLKHALGEETTPRTNMEYAQALERHAGESFIADVTWSSYCNAKKDIKVYDEDDEGNQLSSTIVKDNTPGCGKKFKQDQIPKTEDGTYMDRFTCDLASCDSEDLAVLYSYANLRNFRAAN